MDSKINDKGPSSTEGRAMKVGDKVRVLCEVHEIAAGEIKVQGVLGGSCFWVTDEDCKPVEPEADKTQDTGDILDGCCGWNRAAETVQVVKQPLTPTSDPVNPSHYKQGGIECVEAIKAALLDGFDDYLVGSIIKYIWRRKLKNGIEDLKKARWYLDRLIQEEEAK